MDKGHVNIIRYTDADGARDASDKRSSTEVEYWAMANMTCGLLWLKHSLQELKFWEIGWHGTYLR